VLKSTAQAAWPNRLLDAWPVRPLWRFRPSQLRDKHLPGGKAVTQKELDDLLRTVFVFDGYRRTKSMLSDEQRNAIIVAVLPEVNKPIDVACRDKGQ